MTYQLVRIFGGLLLLKSLDLVARGPRTALFSLVLVGFVAGAAALLAHRHIRVAAGLVAIATALVPIVGGPMHQHQALIVTFAALIALQAPTWLYKSQVSIGYAFSVLTKLNPVFLSGWTIALSFSRSPVGIVLVQAGLVPLLVVATLVAEAFVAVGLWWRPTRLWAMLVGLLLHIGMAILMSSIPGQVIRYGVFAGLMLLVYPMFLERARIVVVWDDSCSFCAGWIRLFRRLDWNGVLDLRPLSGVMPDGISREAATEALQLRIPDGSVYGGYAAVRRIAERLPLTAPFAPILGLLTIPGDRIYRRVAARRSCALPAAA